MILRARVVLPVSRPPIADGAVRIAGGWITSVGRWKDLAPTSGVHSVDLGDSILLPGLVNAHCHLDYTDLAGTIPPPASFPDWIKAIVALKAGWSYSDFAQSWTRGAGMLLCTGTTTVADIEAVPELLPEVWSSTPLRVISFRELIAIKSRGHVAALVRRATEELESLPGHAGRVGLSPHAPYTTSAELLQRAAQIARERGWRLVTHVAESAEEYAMYARRRGPLYHWLKTQRDMNDCGAGSPVRHLERCGYLGENVLAVHVNCLARGDAALLAKRRVQVVHCPRSHAYFGHPKFPHKVLAAAGVNICLGTDSLASTRKIRGRLPRLDLFAEMRAFAERHPEVAPAGVLRLATLNGAQALGRAGELGELAPGALADMIAIPFAGPKSAAAEAVVHYEGEVAGTMIHGQWRFTSTAALRSPPGGAAGG